VALLERASALRHLLRTGDGAGDVLYGRAGGLPADIDLRALPDRAALDRLAVYGAHGTFGTDTGHTLC
jgi:hypothetical protein